MPTYRITAPDGATYEVSGEGSEQEALAAVQAQIGQAAPRSFLQNALLGYGAAGSDLITGLQQVPHRAAANLPEWRILAPFRETSARRLAELETEVASERELRQPLMDTAGGKVGYVTGAVANTAPAFMAAGPTIPGAMAAGALTGLAQPTAEGESAMGNAATSMAFAGGGQAIGQGIGALRSASRAKAASSAAQNAVRDAQISDAVRAGYRLPPAATNPTTANNLLQGLSGKGATAQRAAQLNQPVTDQLARRALGLPDDAPLTEQVIRQKMTAWHNAGYKPVRTAGQINADPEFAQFRQSLAAPRQAMAGDFPASSQMPSAVQDLLDDAARPSWDANNIVEKIRQLRFDSTENFKALGNPAAIDLARTQRSMATAFEDLVERNLQRQGKPGLVAQFRASRQKIAQANDVLDSLLPSGRIDARVLGNKALAGDPLSGPLKTIGQTEALFRRNTLMTNPLAVADSAPAFSPLDAATAFLGATGLATSGHPGWLAAALPAARVGARGLLLSSPYQAAFAAPKYGPSTLQGLAGLLEKPLLRGLLPAAAAGIGLQATQ